MLLIDFSAETLQLRRVWYNILKWWKRRAYNPEYLKMVPKWRRNRMVRPLSPQQIHQKIIWMLSNFHKTTSDCWWRTLGTQQGSPFSSKWGRTKYKRQKERQELRMQTCPWEGVVKEEKLPHSRKPSHRWVCGEFQNLRGQHNREKKTKTKTHRILT